MNAASLVGLIIIGMVLAIVAGAVSGLRIGAESLGKELAAMMGAFFGPTAVLPAVIVGLVVLYFVH